MTAMHLTRWGDAGPRVVLVHGGAQGTRSAGVTNFRAQEPLGSRGWQLIVPDRPGHGLSPSPGRPDDPVADGSLIADLLGDGAHLVGHSFGGLVALAAAAERPRAVRSLTLIEPALHKVAVAHPAVRRTVFGLATTMLLPFSPATRSRRALKLLGIPASFDLNEGELDTMGRALKRARFPSQAVMEGWLANVRTSRIPFQVLSGSSSASFIGIGEIAARKGSGVNVVVPSEHHFPQWAGDPFNERLEAFWTRADEIGAAEARGMTAAG